MCLSWGGKGQTKLLPEVCDPLLTRSSKPRCVMMSAFHICQFQQDVIMLYPPVDRLDGVTQANEISYWIGQATHCMIVRIKA